MARSISFRFVARVVRRIGPLATASAALAALATVALLTVLVGTALIKGPDVGGTTRVLASATAVEHGADPADPATPATSGALVRDRANSGTIETTGSLLPVQLAPTGRALVRFGADARVLTVLLTGLLLAIVGRRPTTRRPVVVPIPVTAAPGLRVRRRGPPLR